MLDILFKILLFNLHKTFGFPKMLPVNYTFSLTYKCNSKCLTCNVYQRKADNLKLAEYEKIFKNIYQRPVWITISGGEPFLRNDIVDICKLLYKHSRPKYLNIPTNGILTNKIVSAVKSIAISMPDTKIVVNVSIDGIEGEHNKIRNCECYDKAMETYQQLKKLTYANLDIGIHTVISTFNVNNFTNIASRILSFMPDSYVTEIAEEREELKNIRTNITPNLISYRSAIDYLIHRIRNRKFRGTTKLIQSFRIEYYKYVKGILANKNKAIPCQAGRLSCQISPDGEVWTCCVKARSLGNLRKNNYKFDKIWFSKKRKNEIAHIKRTKCRCPLANSFYTNSIMHLPTIVRVLYRALLNW